MKVLVTLLLAVCLLLLVVAAADISIRCFCCLMLCSRYDGYWLVGTLDGCSWAEIICGCVMSRPGVRWQCWQVRVLALACSYFLYSLFASLSLIHSLTLSLPPNRPAHSLGSPPLRRPLPLGAAPRVRPLLPRRPQTRAHHAGQRHQPHLRRRRRFST
jgi:hypothetical protein